jgi:hypothetical protein
MTAQTRTASVVFKVLDVMAGPHGGWLMRLRLQSGDTPTLKSLKGTRMRLECSDGRSREVTLKGYPMMGGKPTDARFARSGRIDVQAVPSDGGDADPPHFTGSWELSGPLT